MWHPDGVGIIILPCSHYTILPGYLFAFGPSGRLTFVFLLLIIIHRQRPSLRVFHHLFGLLLKPAFLVRFRGEGDAMGLGAMVFVQVGEGGEAVGGRLFGFTAAVHLGVDGEGALACVDHLALEGDDVASEDRELEIDAMEYQQDGVLGVNILSHGEIRALQKPFGASASEEGLMMVEVGEFD